MTTQEQIAEYIAKNGVTKCPPALAKGSEATRALKAHVAKERRQWRKDNKAKRG
jgi:hypothetical protein